jgi:hypothetical protein
MYRLDQRTLKTKQQRHFSLIVIGIWCYSYLEPLEELSPE